MKLVIFNGSPRKSSGNTQILLNKLIEGFSSDVAVESNLFLKDLNRVEQFLTVFEESDMVVIGFPLYTDAMPGVVKYFLEKVYANRPFAGKKLVFLVQSGFPESVHMEALEKYLKRYSQKLQCDYLGTILKGGAEGIHLMPENRNKKLFGRMKQLGVSLEKEGVLDSIIMEQLKKPHHLTRSWIVLFKILKFFGLLNFYWNSNLKKNKVYHLRHHAPYAK